MDLSHEEAEEKLRLVALPEDEQTEETKDRLAELLAIEDGAEPDPVLIEEITVTVKLTYSCDAADTLEAQRDQIAVDLLSLVEGQGTASASCVEFDIKDVAPEAITYGTAEGEQISQYRSRRITSALKGLYLDGDRAGNLLTNALCDLRHLAFQNRLYFSQADKSAQQFFQAERHAAKREQKS